MQQISVIIPTLNEAGVIDTTLARLQPLRQRGHEVILVDGGSLDATLELARPQVDRIVTCKAGRARQMNAGASRANGKILWFVHADTIIPEQAEQAIQQAVGNQGLFWGRFDVRLSGRDIRFRLIERLMNWRSRLSGIATGDQGIFISRELFEQLNGYADLPLMEDIELSRRLKHHARPCCLYEKIVTSSRRWEQRGIWRTVFLMWRLRLLYALGSDTHKLARLYR